MLFCWALAILGGEAGVGGLRMQSGKASFCSVGCAHSLKWSNPFLMLTFEQKESVSPPLKRIVFD